MCRREAGEEFISVGEYNVCKQGERKEIDANQTILPSSSCSFFCACTSACQCLFSLCPRRPPHPSWCASHVPLCPPHLHAFGRNVTPNIAVNHSLLVVVTYETPFPPQIQQQKTPKGRLHRSAMPRTCPDPGRRRSSIFTEKKPTQTHDSSTQPPKHMVCLSKSTRTNPPTHPTPPPDSTQRKDAARSHGPGHPRPPRSGPPRSHLGLLLLLLLLPHPFPPRHLRLRLGRMRSRFLLLPQGHTQKTRRADHAAKVRRWLMDKWVGGLDGT